MRKWRSFRRGYSGVAGNMSLRILLTGGGGFVGGQILEVLIEKGLTVCCVVRAARREKLALDKRIDSILISDDLFAESDAWWEDVLRGVDVVIHCAWYVEPGKYLQSMANLHCLEGTLRMARAAAMVRVSKFVGLGTCFEYDVDEGYLSVNTQLRPRSLYAGAKAAAYLSLEQLFLNFEVDFLWCRLFYLYGAGEDARRLVPYLHKKLKDGETVDLTDGEQVRDYLDVRCAAEMIVHAALSDRVGPMNICSGKAVTVRQMCEMIADQYGRRDLLKFGVRPHNPIDPMCVVGIP